MAMADMVTYFAALRMFLISNGGLVAFRMNVAVSPLMSRCLFPFWLVALRMPLLLCVEPVCLEKPLWLSSVSCLLHNVHMKVDS